jgi:hypothetical protein
MATLQQAANGDLKIDDISAYLVEAFCEPEKKPKKKKRAEEKRSEP